ncbi:restriction endonuclease subunit S [Gammaproteobacteria bacterium]|nr:restriction endonuclease subunit S [Gammaproteobacteria bacterium]
MSEFLKTSLEYILHKPISGSRPKGGVSIVGEIPSLGGENITMEGGLKLEVVKKISSEFFKSMPRGQLRNLDVLINKDGANTGKSSIYRKSPFLNAAVNEHLFILRGKEGELDQEYLHHLLQFSLIRAILEIKITGSAQPGINSTFVKNFPVDLAPFTEQKKIASILNSVDEVIDNTQKQIDKLQDLKKATMNELLTKGIGHKEFKDSELGQIPRSWEVVELSSLVNSTRPITYGIVQTGEHIPYGIPCVRVVDIVKGKPILERMIRTTQQINDSYSRTVLQENDIMFALRGNIGFVRKVESFLRGANLTRGIALISNSEEITSDYLLYALQSQVVRRQIADGVNGSALQEIPLGNLRTVKVPVPCKTEQTGISEVIASLEKLIETSLLKLHQTQSLKKSLMQDLLTGKVRVTVN